MNNNGNLTHKLTVEEQRLGGKKSAESRRKKKQMREITELILSMNIKSGRGATIENITNLADLAGKNITVGEAIIVKQVQKALKGDLSAAYFVRDTSGQKPDNKPDQTDVLDKLDSILGGIDAIANE